MAWLFRLLGTVFALYAAYAAIMVWQHPKFIYPFDLGPFSDPAFVQKTLLAADGTEVSVQVHTAGPNAPVVLYFMGNAGSLVYFRELLAVHTGAGRSVVAMEYRGGGGRPGMPSETALKSDALLVFDTLPDLLPGGYRPVILHGYSMGSGLAMHLAAQRKADGLMLDAPYARMCELMTRASRLPACWLPFVQRWDNLALTQAVNMPVLVQIGGIDQAIPSLHGERLAAALSQAGNAVSVKLWPERGHADLIDEPGWGTAMTDFIAALQ